MVYGFAVKCLLKLQYVVKKKMYNWATISTKAAVNCHSDVSVMVYGFAVRCLLKLQYVVKKKTYNWATISTKAAVNCHSCQFYGIWVCGKMATTAPLWCHQNEQRCHF